GACDGAVDCDDDNPCTVDACVGAACVHTPDAGRACDDGDACTAGDTCRANGQCGGGCEVCDATGHVWDPTCAEPGAICAGGMMCHLGICGDAWCDDATETHESCPADCFDTCMGNRALCARKLPDVTVLSAHNADVSTAYPFPGLINYNQSFSLSTQLDHGVRRLLLDIAYCVPEGLGGGAGTSADWMCLCHGDHCYGGLLPLAWGLEEIASWMADHPSEVVEIQLENYVDEVALHQAFEDAGLTRWFYDAPEIVALEGGCDLRALDEIWPWSLNNMARRDKRLLVFGGGNLDGGCLLASSGGAAPPGTDVACFKKPLEPGQLYALSQLQGLLCDPSGCWGDLFMSMCANTVEAMNARVAACQAELDAIDTTGWVSARGAPLTPRIHAVNVDFYHAGAGPTAVVEALNGVHQFDTDWVDVCGETPVLLPCASDLDCATNVCVDHFCAECARDSDCASGEFCDPVLKLCWAKLDDGAPCVEADNCRSGTCHLLCGGCASSADCTSGEFCDPTARCVPKRDAGAFCLANAWCESGSCPLGRCAECDANADCDAADHCDAFGVCAADVANGLPCGGNGWCRSGHCFGGLCVACTTNQHCGSGDYCLAGACVPKAPTGTPCTADAQCQGACNGGLCMACDEDGDCDAGEYCSFLDLGSEPNLGNGGLCFGGAE
ncbi:MAG: hypothetical protein KC635_16940, partial [Myxococcales bacterium]|nr:hypothetical protein [Myxococcales bacterium]